LPRTSPSKPAALWCSRSSLHGDWASQSCQRRSPRREKTCTRSRSPSPNCAGVSPSPGEAMAPSAPPPEPWSDGLGTCSILDGCTPSAGSRPPTFCPRNVSISPQRVDAIPRRPTPTVSQREPNADLSPALQRAPQHRCPGPRSGAGRGRPHRETPPGRQRIESGSAVRPTIEVRSCSHRGLVLVRAGRPGGAGLGECQGASRIRP
jgi:hypothetical protein